MVSWGLGQRLQSGNRVAEIIRSQSREALSRLRGSKLEKQAQKTQAACRRGDPKGNCRRVWPHPLTGVRRWQVGELRPRVPPLSLVGTQFLAKRAARLLVGTVF